MRVNVYQCFKWCTGMSGLMKVFFILLLSTAGQGKLAAQSPADSLELFREFIAVNRSFKQVPLQMSVVFKQFSNLAPADSGKKFKGDFFIQKNRAYINFGAIEQLVNDTMALVVMKDSKQMFLSTNNTPVAEYMKSVTMQPLHDTDMRKAAAIFTIRKARKENNISQLELVSRDKIGEGLPNSVITLLYDNAGKKPLRLTMIKRSLGKLPADSGAFKKGIENGRIQLTTIKDRGNFIIKEEVSDIEYIKIEQAINVKLPAVITERVTRNTEGEFEPAKGYEAYHLTSQLQQ
jgi:hypothetical protein